MNTNEFLPSFQAYHFEARRKQSFAGDLFNRESSTTASVNNYLKTLAEIDADFLSANGEPVPFKPGYMERTDQFLENGFNDTIVSPSTRYHGFMEENY
jgi:hypothetical protein